MTKYNYRKYAILSLIVLLSFQNQGCSNKIHKTQNLEDEVSVEVVEEVLNKQDVFSIKSVQEGLKKGDQAYHQGKQGLAIAYYVKAYELDKMNITPLERLFKLHQSMHNYEMAALALKLMVEINPANMETVEHYGLTLIELRDFDLAKEMLNRSLSSGESRWKALNGLGIIADIEEQHVQAFVYFEAAEKMNPGNPELFNNMGYSLYLAGDLQESVRYFFLALDKQPHFKKALYNLALVKARLREYKTAYRLFSKISEPSQANNNIGYIAMMNNDTDIAKDFFKKAISLSPSFYKKANENLARLKNMQN